MGFDRDFFSSNFEDWMAINGTSDTVHNQNSPPWKIMFSFAMWMIWKNRNHFVFRGRSQNPRLARLITDYALEFFFCAGPTKGLRTWVTSLVKWGRLEIGWLKSNTDGSSLGNPRVVVGGGVIWDWFGKWIVGFSRKIDIVMSLLAELWAIRDGCSILIETWLWLKWSWMQR